MPDLLFRSSIEYFLTNVVHFFEIRLEHRNKNNHCILEVQQSNRKETSFIYHILDFALTTAHVPINDTKEIMATESSNLNFSFTLLANYEL